MSSSDPWNIGAIEPTSLRAFWPHAEPPTKLEVLAAAGSDVREIDSIDPEDEVVRWATVVELPDHGEPVILWVEPARALSPDQIDDVRTLGCEWLIGAETRLDVSDPLRSHAAVVRLLARAFEEIPSILDTNSHHWYRRQRLDEHFLDPHNDPPPEVLWAIHAVAPALDEELEDAPVGAWLHTHGLRRAGRPELEMLEVPGEAVSSAGELINTIAARLLEEPVPAPGSRFPIGEGVEVTLQPWPAVAPFVGRDAPGGMDDRRGGDNVHAGPGAVICGVEPEGRFRKVWRWPREAIELIERNDGLVYISREATARAAARARATWPRLVAAFLDVPAEMRRTDAGAPRETDRPAARFLVKAGLRAADRPPDDAAEEDADREHMWFVVRRFEDDRVEGVLLNRPVLVTRLSEGDVVWLERGIISDWTVITPAGTYGPLDASRLGGLAGELRGLRDGGSGAAP